MPSHTHTCTTTNGRFERHPWAFSFRKSQSRTSFSCEERKTTTVSKANVAFIGLLFVFASVHAPFTSHFSILSFSPSLPPSHHVSRIHLHTYIQSNMHTYLFQLLTVPKGRCINSVGIAARHSREETREKCCSMPCRLKMHMCIYHVCVCFM